jgi:release factor glutamine methyltransferase
MAKQQRDLYATAVRGQYCQRRGCGNSVQAAVAAATATFSSAGIPEAALSAAHLVAAAVGRSQEFASLSVMGGDGSLKLSAEEEVRLAGFVARRLAREPVQMVVGEWDFHDITLWVQAGVLCPRPETEELVEHVIATLARTRERDSDRGLRGEGGEGDGDDWGGARVSTTRRYQTVLDIGTGTGAIGIALTAADDGLLCDAIDICPVAVKLALRNAVRAGVENRYRCTIADVADLQQKSSCSRYDVVVSNPPYIPEGDAESLAPEVLLYEPSAALFGGDDLGMAVVNQILTKAPDLLNPWGSLWLEIDPSQPPLIKAEVAKPGSRLQFVDSYQDVYGVDRFVRLELLPCE